MKKGLSRYLFQLSLWLFICLASFCPIKLQAAKPTYPDMRQTVVKDGTITKVYSASGTTQIMEHEKYIVNLVYTSTTQIRQRVITEKVSVQGSIKTLTTFDGETIEQTYAISHTETNDLFGDMEIYYSQKLNRAYFYPGILFGRQVPATHTALGMKQKTTFHLGSTDIPGQSLQGRLPGNDQSSFVETAWNNGSTNGSITQNLNAWTDGMSLRWDSQDQGAPSPPLKGSLNISWSFGSSPAKDRMFIRPENPKEYERLVPTAAELGDESDRREISFTSGFEENEGSHEPLKGRIHFWLRNVSKNPGYCTNYSIGGKSQDTSGDDLRFVSGQDGIIIDPADPRHAYTESKETSEATIIVESRDAGAFGSIQATCEELGLIAKYEATGGQSIAIPADTNNNHIADYWEQQMGILHNNYKETWDEDAYPAEQRRNGDGYTLFEEYRGFMTKNGFIRTHPSKKDVFVYDPDELIKTYYEPYNPAKLALHYIDPTMMKFNGEANNPDNRWVNVNTPPERCYTRQYAIFVKRWTIMDDTGGEVSRVTDKLNKLDAYSWTKNPVKSIYMLKISPGTIEMAVRKIENLAVRQNTFQLLLTSTVIHEFGHYIGIRHHMEGAQASSGVFDCAMRYNTEAEYTHPELLKPQYRYCMKGEKYKVPQGMNFIEKPAHNCFGQIDIKSDP